MARVKRGEIQEKLSRVREPASASPERNEGGMALVLALVMLALLTILGAWAIDTSSTDLAIADNYRNTQNAFYSADEALAYAMKPDTLSMAYVYSLATDSTVIWSPVSSIGTGTANIQITYLGSGPLPAGPIYDGDLDVSGDPRFHGLYFAVNIEGKAENNATVVVEAAVVQVAEEQVIVGCGDDICTSSTIGGDQVFTLYWRQR